jgi:invasion protein IalB
MSSIARPLTACGLLIALTAGASAESAKKPEKEANSGKPALVASYGDWSVFQSQTGKSHICYTLAQPKERSPADLKRDPAYAFISERPAERVRNEVSFIMGFEVGAAPAAESKDKDKDKKRPEAKDKDPKDRKAKSEPISPTAVIGDVEFDLLPKGSNVWVKNAAEESQLIDEMRKGVKLTIKAASKKGNVTIDSYSLSGFSQAIDRALKDCPGT